MYEDMIDHRRCTHNLSSCEIKVLQKRPEPYLGLNFFQA